MIIFLYYQRKYFKKKNLVDPAFYWFLISLDLPLNHDQKANYEH